MPEKSDSKLSMPFFGRWPGSGFFALWGLVGFLAAPAMAWAGDGATEALELRLAAEQAISQEHTAGNRALGDMMRQLLHGQVLEYLASRDETIALDVVDTAFVREQFDVAQQMEQSGLAWALDVFAGPGTGHEHQLRTSLSSLADFHEVRARRATEAALKAYERGLEHQLDKAEKANEDHLKLDSHRLEAKLIGASERLVLKAEKVAEKAAEKSADKAEKAAEKAEKTAEKAEDKAEKDAEKAADADSSTPTDPTDKDKGGKKK